MSNRVTGIIGEADAYRYIVKSGMRPLCKNYRKHSGEIDLIAREKDTIVFIEVKARTSFLRGSPAEAITSAKRRQIVRTALLYLKENGLLESRIRFDVLAIEGDTIRHIKSAFDATGIF